MGLRVVIFRIHGFRFFDARLGFKFTFVGSLVWDYISGVMFLGSGLPGWWFLNLFML